MKRFFLILRSIMCLSMLFAISVSAETPSSEKIHDLNMSIEMLEQKYDVTIKEAPTARAAETYTDSEIESMLQDLESQLIRGKEAREKNQNEYNKYIKETEASNREDDIVTDKIFH